MPGDPRPQGEGHPHPAVGQHRDGAILQGRRPLGEASDWPSPEQLAVASDMQSHERPPMSKTDVKKLYQQAKKEYNSGDWNSARKHFEMAIWSSRMKRLN